MGQSKGSHNIGGGQGRRLLALLLSLAMLLGMAPGLALGEGNTGVVVGDVVFDGQIDPTQDATSQDVAGDTVAFGGVVLLKDSTAGLAGATVTVFTADGLRIGNGVSGADGKWQVSASAKAGNYYATVACEGYTFVSDTTATLTLTEGTAVLSFDTPLYAVAAPKPATLRASGKVVTEAGEGLAGVTVIASSGGGAVAETVSGADGTWAIDGLALAADYAFAYQAEGYASFVAPAIGIVIVEGQTDYPVGQVTAIAAEQEAAPTQPETAETKDETQADNTATTEQTTPGTADMDTDVVDTTVDNTLPTDDTTVVGDTTVTDDTTVVDDTTITDDTTVVDGTTVTDDTTVVDGTVITDDTTVVNNDPPVDNTQTDDDDGGLFTFTGDDTDGFADAGTMISTFDTEDQTSKAASTAVTAELFKFLVKELTVRMDASGSGSLALSSAPGGNVEVVPSGASLIEGLTYTISPANIAKVDTSGTTPQIVGLAAGAATLTVRVAKYGQEISIPVTVTYENDVNVTSMNFWKNPVEIYHSGTVRDLNDYLVVEPASAKNALSWELETGFTVMDINAATGVVTLKPGMTGTATVKVTSRNGIVARGTVVVKMSEGVEKITHTNSTVDYAMVQGQTRQFRLMGDNYGDIIVEPSTASKEVEWSVISGAARLRVVNSATGLFEALDVGQAKVRVATKQFVGTVPSYAYYDITINITNDDAQLTGLSFGESGDAIELELKKTGAQTPVDLYPKLVTTPANFPLSSDTANLEWVVTAGGSYITMGLKKMDNGLYAATVTPVKIGTATVQVRDTVSGRRATVNINVVDPTLVSDIWFAPHAESDVTLDLASNRDKTLDLKNTLLGVSPAGVLGTSTFTWSVTSGQSIVAVDRNGLVTARAIGKATIQVTATNGNKSATIDVYVINSGVVSDISFTQALVTWGLHDGDLDMNKLIAKIEPESANAASRTWSVTSGQSFFRINSATGILTPLKIGSGVVRVTINNGAKYDTIAVKIVDHNAPTEFSLYGGEKAVSIPIKKILGTTRYESFPVQYAPSTILPEDITWRISGSSNTGSGSIYPGGGSSYSSVATVDAKGNITPLRAGVCVLTGTTSNGLSASVTITLYDAGVPTAITFNPPSQWYVYTNDYKANVLELEKYVTATGIEDGTLPSYSYAITGSSGGSTSTGGNTSDRWSSIYLRYPSSGGGTGSVSSGSTTSAVANLNGKTGTLTPLKKGSVTIRVTEAHSGKTATATINLIDPTEPTRIYIFGGVSTKTITLSRLGSGYATVTPEISFVPTGDEDYLKGQLTWTSSNTSVATINTATGVITPLKAGTTTITVRMKNYTSISASCQLTFVDGSAAATLSLSRLNGMAFQLYDAAGVLNVIDLAGYVDATAVDGSVATPTLTWSVSPTTLASIDAKTGKITFKKEGTVTVTVRATSATTGTSSSSTGSGVFGGDRTSIIGGRFYHDIGGNTGGNTGGSTLTATAKIYIDDTTKAGEVTLKAPAAVVKDGANTVTIVKTGTTYDDVQIDWLVEAMDDGRDPNTTITWTSSNNAIVGFTTANNKTAVNTRSGHIMVTPKRTGTVTITATTTNGQKDSITLVFIDSGAITKIEAVQDTHALDYADRSWGETIDLQGNEYINVTTYDGGSYDRSELVYTRTGGAGWYASLSTDGKLVLNRAETGNMRNGADNTMHVTVKSKSDANIVATFTIVFANSNGSFAVEGGPELAWDTLNADGSFAPMTVSLTAGSAVGIGSVAVSPTSMVSGTPTIAKDGRSVTINARTTGTLTVTLTGKTGGYKTVCYVTFKDDTRVTSLTLADVNAAKTIDVSTLVGRVFDLEAANLVTSVPANAYDDPNNTKVWTVIQGKDTIASVTDNGLLSFKNTGTITLRVSDSRSGVVSNTITVYVVDSDMITSIKAKKSPITWDRADLTDEDNGLVVPLDPGTFFTFEPKDDYTRDNLKWQITDAASRAFVKAGTVKDWNDLCDEGKVSTLQLSTTAGEGSMTLKLLDERTGHSATVTLNIVDYSQPASVQIVGIEAINNRWGLYQGQLTSLSAHAVPKTGSAVGDIDQYADFVWTVADGGGAVAITPDGVLTPLAKGRVKLTVTDRNSGKTTTMSNWLIIYDETPKAAKISCDGTQYTDGSQIIVNLAPGATLDIAAIATAENGYDVTDLSNVTWTSGNASVLTPASGTGSMQTFTVAGTGNAKITMTAEGGNRGSVSTSLIVVVN